MKQSRFTTFVMVLAALVMVAAPLIAQNLTTPRASSYASVSQRIGITDVTITYHRPGVKGRAIWGALVPNGMAKGQNFNNGIDFPWRAGANENTTITFTHDVSIEGQNLAAGNYGLHMLPSENEMTIIFSKDNMAWGSFFYDPHADALRVTVSPSDNDHLEWLQYGFEDLSNTSAVAYLHWEKKRIPFKIEVDTPKIVLNNMRSELKSLAGFRWQAYLQAANYCLQNNMATDEALSWADNSINRDKNINNLSVKARLLVQANKTAESNTAIAAAVKFAKNTGVESDLNTAGYLYFQTDQVDKAIEIFKLNVKKHSDSWNAYDSLGEAYAKKGKTKDAVKNYKTALDKAPENQKQRIQGVLDNLQKMTSS